MATIRVFSKGVGWYCYNCKNLLREVKKDKVKLQTLSKENYYIGYISVPTLKRESGYCSDCGAEI